VVDAMLAVRARRRGEAHGISLLPASAWILSSCWLWNSKPEVWFTYYIHLSIWVFAGIALLKLSREGKLRTATALAGMLLLPLAGAMGWADVSQVRSLSRSTSWRWSTYEDFVSCVDSRLSELYAAEGSPKEFRVWAPTFPDITIELSRRHPEWLLTRTNDFWDRVPLAIQHGRNVDAMVVTEMINWAERNISAPMSEHPEIQSVWMNWRGYYLHQFTSLPGWKPNRYLCQRGRWQAFLYMKAEPGAGAAAGTTTAPAPAK
jgi:hypothetical protein